MGVTMFAKVFQKMLDSSIWLESDSTLRVWITLLLSMDSEGFAAFASIENLSRRARVKPSLTKRAVEILESPDPNSTTPTEQGRRIRRVDGGWVVVNCRKYREISRHGDLRASRQKPEQLEATQNDSAQHGLPTQLSTNEINKSVPEIEIEKEIVHADFLPIEAARGFLIEFRLTGGTLLRDAEQAIALRSQLAGCEALDACSQLKTEYRSYLDSKPSFEKGAKSWLSQCNKDFEQRKAPRKWKVVGNG
jgi:hypothetical protein